MEIESYRMYARQQVYDTLTSSQAGTKGTRTTTTDQKDTASASNQSDHVSISTAGKLAQLRSLLGLDSSQSRLTKADITAAVESDKSTVTTAVQDIVNELDIPSGTTFSLYADDEGRIRVKGSFEGSEQVEKCLNKDQEIMDSFNRLSVNQTMLELPQTLHQNMQKSLVDFLSGDENDSFETLMDDYSFTKELDNPIDTVLYYTNKSSGSYELPFTVKDSAGA